MKFCKLFKSTSFSRASNATQVFQDKREVGETQGYYIKKQEAYEYSKKPIKLFTCDGCGWKTQKDCQKYFSRM